MAGTSKPLAVENLSATALSRFRALVTESKNVDEKWKAAILEDTKDGVPENLANVVSLLGGGPKK